MDQPIAALLEDLEQRGLLDETLVVWGGEFGRMPFSEGKDAPGRNHNPYGFSMWMAGSGVKGGTVYGETDEFGFEAMVDRVHVHDIHATILHLMGIDHVGIGSDLCLDQPDYVVEWMRNGTWTKTKDYGEGSKSDAAFPRQPDWFENTLGFNNLESGLKEIGFDDKEVDAILGDNWFNFYRENIH